MNALNELVVSSADKEKKIKALQELLNLWKEGKEVHFIINASESLNDITPLEISVVHSSSAVQEASENNGMNTGCDPNY